MRGRCFLVTYHPIIRRGAGRQAVAREHLPPFIDGSCRREPDLESPYPSITATCRAGLFAPRLAVGDEIAYLTVKGRYLGDTEPGWRLVAVLRVIRKFNSHGEAAEWYTSEGLPLPSNCFVSGNPPKPLNLTNAWPPDKIRSRMLKGLGDDDVVELWDRSYRRRIRESGDFLACEPLMRQLRTPPQLREADINGIFGRMPCTQNPPRIRRDQLARLLQVARGRGVAALRVAPDD